MKRVLTVLIVLALALSLCACGSKEPEVDIIGTYYATSCFVNGSECSCDGEYVRLDKGGAGVVMFMDTEYTIEWEYKGGTLTFTDSDGDGFTGTCENGVIDGVYANMDYTFAKNAGTGKGKTDAPAQPETGTEPAVAAKEPAPKGGSGFTPVGGELEDCCVEIVGAEHFEDSAGEPGIRFYYDFTNNSDETVSSWWALNYTAKQDGYELVGTYASSEDDVAEYGNDSLDVRPGVTIRCIDEYTYKPDGGTLEFIIDDYDNELVAEFDPAELPGRPAVDWEIAPIEDPQWITDWPTEGTYDEDYYVVLTNYEVVDGWHSGEYVIRVYMEFTNNSDEATSCWWATSINAYQDGIELSSEWADEDVPEDDNFQTDIEPGETITCSETFALRTASPVEIAIADSWSESYIGGVVPVV